MNVKRVLCPIDYSEFNPTANEFASTFAQSSGAEIVYLHVSAPEVPYGSESLEDLARQKSKQRQRLEEFSPTADGITCSHVVKFGSPAERIVEYAVEHDVDLIVLATHGRTGMGRIVMGSVAEAVVRKAKCPVLTVKAGEHAVCS